MFTYRVCSRVLLLTIGQNHGVKILWSAHKLSTICVCKQRACKQTHRKIAAVTRSACYNLKMLSQSYLIYLTKTFSSVNKIFGRVKKTIQAKTLVDLSKRVWLTGQKFGRLNQNVLWNQPNIVSQNILLDEPFFFLSVAVRSVEVSPCNTRFFLFSYNVCVGHHYAMCSAAFARAVYQQTLLPFYRHQSGNES